MNGNLKIVFSTIIAFAIVMIFLNIVMDYNSTNNRLYQLKEKFYANEFDSEKKHVFILGASTVAHVNTTYINEYINNPEINVYNLAVPADRPTERLETINKLASVKPALVVYGLSFRDFTPTSSSDDFRKNANPPSYLPNPQNYIENILNPILIEPELMKFKSPKFVTLSIIKNALGVSGERPLRGELTDQKPFFDFDKEERREILNETQMKIKMNSLSKFHPIGSPDSNVQILAMKKILNVLKDNDIKFVIYTTPYHPMFLELDSGKDHVLFDLILENLSHEFDFKIYDIKDKYADLNIWNDSFHITMHEKGNIHNEDVGDLILNELGTQN